jgi:hypothetical protein
MCKFAVMETVIRCNRDGENRVLTLKVGLSCWNLIDFHKIVLIGKVLCLSNVRSSIRKCRSKNRLKGSSFTDSPLISLKLEI